MWIRTTQRRGDKWCLRGYGHYTETLPTRPYMLSIPRVLAPARFGGHEPGWTDPDLRRTHYSDASTPIAAPESLSSALPAVMVGAARLGPRHPPAAPAGRCPVSFPAAHCSVLSVVAIVANPCPHPADRELTIRADGEA